MGFRNKNLNLKDLLPPAQIDPSPRPQTQMTFMDTLVHKMKEMANPITGPIQHWANDPVQQANSNLLLGGPMGMAHVWHGSPHKFTKFRMDKIGTGEGAQAYGHGLYFADKKGVAQSYADMLGRGSLKLDVETKKALDSLDNLGFSSRGEAMGNIRKYPDWMQRWDVDPERDKSALAAIKRQLAKEPPAPNLYKVDLPDEAISKMIDFDKPYRLQPKKVKNLFKELGWSADSFVGPNSLHNQPTPEKMIALLEKRLGPDGASDMLKERGFTGVKYLDQVSRKGGKGTHNYVVFDENIPKILEMNHLPVEGLPFGGK